MTIFIGCDHNGFEMKNKIIEYLQEKNIRVEDMGNYEHDPLDDYPDYIKKVAEAVLQNPEEFMGIGICGSSVGVTICANRFKGIRAAAGLTEEQIAHARSNDHINFLALSASYKGHEFMSLDQAKKLVDVFMNTEVNPAEKYVRRNRKLDEL